MADIIRLFIILLFAIALSCSAYAAHVYTSDEVDSLISQLSESLGNDISDLNEDLSSAQQDTDDEVDYLGDKLDDIEQRLDSIEQGNDENITELKDAVEELKAKLEIIENNTLTPFTIISQTPYSLEIRDVELVVSTNNDAECRYSMTAEDYSNMENSFSTTGSDKHKSRVDAKDGLNIFFVSCIDLNNQIDDQIVLFEVGSGDYSFGISSQSQTAFLEPDSEEPVEGESNEETEDKEGIGSITGNFWRDSRQSNIAAAIIVLILIISIVMVGYYRIYKADDDKLEF